MTFLSKVGHIKILIQSRITKPYINNRIIFDRLINRYLEIRWVMVKHYQLLICVLALTNYYSGLKIYIFFFFNCVTMFSSENDQVWKQRIWYIYAKSFFYIGASTIFKHLKFQHFFWFTRSIGLQDQLNKNFNSIHKFSSILLTNAFNPNEHFDVV